MSDVPAATDKLAAALVKFQSAVPTIPKNRTAKIPTKSGGSYSYSYADLTDIWDAIRGLLFSNGLAVTQALVGGANGHIGIQTVVWHESGQHFVGTVEVPTGGKSAQEVGSQITYFKRYALAATLGISTDEDDDGQAASPPKPNKQAVHQAGPLPSAPLPPEAFKPANQDGQDALLRVCEKKGHPIADVADAFRERFGKHPRNAPNDELMSFAMLLDEGAITLGVSG